MPIPTRRIARRLTALALAAALVGIVVSATIASGSDGAWDLGNPNTGVYRYQQTNIVGFAPRGVVFDVTADTPVSALGVRARFGAETTLSVEVREVSDRTPGDVIASGSVVVEPSATFDFLDVPLPATLVLQAGHRYDVRFQIPGGWGMGGSNWIEQQTFGNADFNAAKFFVPEAGSPFTVVDGGGNSFSTAYTYAWETLPHVHVVGAALDADPPTIAVHVSSVDGQAASGWYNAASSGHDGVTVEVAVDDASPLQSVECRDGKAPVLDTTMTVSSFELGDGFHSITCTAVDAYGNTGSTDAPVDLKVDQTPPGLSPTVAPNPVREGQWAEAFPRATDAFGVVDASCDAVATKPVGHHSVACRAEDAAGNDATADADYDVLRAFDGFFAPVRMTGTNTAKAGSSIPLKFSIGEYDGLDILAAGSPSVTPCGASSPVVAASGKLSYDPDTGDYVYVWKTDRAWARSCMTVTVRLDDGSAESVEFALG